VKGKYVKEIDMEGRGEFVSVSEAIYNYALQNELAGFSFLLYVLLLLLLLIN
jgi:hypothetical protein